MPERTSSGARVGTVERSVRSVSEAREPSQRIVLAAILSYVSLGQERRNATRARVRAVHEPIAAVVTVETDALAVEFLAVADVRAPACGGVTSRARFRVAAGSPTIGVLPA